MFFKQFFLGCLAHASYMIGSEGVACVVDPQRDVDQYIEEAEANGFKIKYIVETHLHADFVGGHKELALRTGAEVVFSSKAGATCPHKGVKEGDELALGKVKLSFLETPGHTPESICILITGEGEKSPSKVLTGDTLFIGDVGRPDLAGKKGFTSQEMASLLYDSLHDKLLKLDDAVEVYPAHGAGSLCGKNMSSERSSTIGQQRKFNYALKPMSKEQFVDMMCSDLPEAPAYFSAAVEKNKEGAMALKELPKPEALSCQKIQKETKDGVLVLDVRSGAQFGAGHIAGSMNLGLGGQFASWAGSLIPIGTKMILVGENDAAVDEAVMRLARAGHESVIGYLDGGMASWEEAGLAIVKTPQISADELKERLSTQKDLQVIDVRRPGEYKGGHVPGAINIPLNELRSNLAKVDKNRPTAIICASGYRSSAATCILKDYGVADVCNTAGGTNGYRAAGHEVESSEQAATTPSCSA